MLPQYVDEEKHCEWCNNDIFIGYEAVTAQGMYFCEEECLMLHLAEGEQPVHVYLTNNKKYRSDD